MEYFIFYLGTILRIFYVYISDFGNFQEQLRVEFAYKTIFYR